MEHNIGIYSSFIDFLEKNQNYNFLFPVYDSKIRELRFKTQEEVQIHLEASKTKKYKVFLYARGKNVNYIFEFYDTNTQYGNYSNCLEVIYVYENPPINGKKILNSFFYPEPEDCELFDYIFENYLVDFLREKTVIKEYKWIKDKIFRYTFKPCKEKGKKHILELCFIGSCDPDVIESYLGHRVIKKHGHILLKQHNKKSIYVRNEYVYME